MIQKLQAAQAPRPRLFKVKSLRLDLTNDRFEGTAKNEREAINHMIAEYRTKMYALATHIMSTGTVNPTELPMVVPEGGHKVAVEGNRRLTCLKLLMNPELADDKNVVRRFTKIRESSLYVVPTEILCLPFDSREDANPWIFLRHTGENEGVGVVGWSSAQAGRFGSRVGTQKRRKEEMFVDLIRREYADDEAVLSALELVQTTQYTTLGRLLISPEVLSRMGLVASHGQMHLLADPTESRDLFFKVLGDLGSPRNKENGEKSWSRELNQLKDRLRYIDQFVELHPVVDPQRRAQIQNSTEAPSAKTSNKPTPAPLVDQSVAASQSQYSPPAPINPPRQMSSELMLFSSVDFSGFNPRLNRLGDNAKKVRMDPMYDVAGILARVTVELCTTEFLERHAKTVDKNLWRNIRTALLILDPNVTEEPRAKAEFFKVFRSIDNGEKGLAVRSMQSFVHDTLSAPAPSEVRHISGLFSPMLQAMSENLSGGHKKQLGEK